MNHPRHYKARHSPKNGMDIARRQRNKGCIWAGLPTAKHRLADARRAAKDTKKALRNLANQEFGGDLARAKMYGGTA